MEFVYKWVLIVCGGCLAPCGECNLCPHGEGSPLGTNDMLKSAGTPALLLKLGTWRCMCIRNASLDEGLRARIRPLVFCGYACWCDKQDFG